jgi:hypothetical protein
MRREKREMREMKKREKRKRTRTVVVVGERELSKIQYSTTTALRHTCIDGNYCNHCICCSRQ